MQRQTAFLAFMMTNRQGFLDGFAANTGLACAVRVDFPDSFTSVFSFVLECLQKVSPTRVSDRFRQMMIFHHLADLQIFDSDFIKPRYSWIILLYERPAQRPSSPCPLQSPCSYYPRNSHHHPLWRRVFGLAAKCIIRCAGPVDRLRSGLRARHRQRMAVARLFGQGPWTALSWFEEIWRWSPMGKDTFHEGAVSFGSD